MSDFILVRTHRFDVLLVKHDVVRSSREIEDALLGSRYTMKNAQKQSPLLARVRRCLVGRQVLHEDRYVFDSTAELFGNESSESSTTLMKASRFILHLLVWHKLTL
jgi:hypothetical protein